MNYFQRDDGSNISSLVGKLWSIAFTGKIGGDTVDNILKKGVTKEGAEELVKAWIDKELWPQKNWSKIEIIDYIRNAAMQGLVYTDKTDNLEIVKQIYDKEYDYAVNTKKFTKLCAYAIDSMVARDFIAEHSIEDYFNLCSGSSSEIMKTLGPYIVKYSPSPPKD